MYSTIVIGGGPGGYACAIRAAQLGGNVCLIEKNGLGGTCTQRGCISTKYLHSLGHIIRRATGAKKNGLNVQIELNYKLLKSRMDATVSRLASGIKLLLKSNGVNLLEGEAHIISTSSLLELEALPASITIIGGGYSGCEFASILNALGCKVSLIEAEDHLMPFQIKEIVAERILVCIGRKPNINPNELNGIGIKFDRQGVSIDEKMRTNIPNVYAIGDVTGMYELAHVASKQGEVVAENIMGIKDNKIDYRSLPVCVFTYPEVAFVGDLDGRSGEFPLAASAKANCLGDTRGLIKVFEKEGRLVGTYIIAPHAGEIIGEAVLAIKMKLSPKDVSDMIHAHPTLPESFAEAVRDINSES